MRIYEPEFSYKRLSRQFVIWDNRASSSSSPYQVRVDLNALALKLDELDPKELHHRKHVLDSLYWVCSRHGWNIKYTYIDAIGSSCDSSIQRKRFIQWHVTHDCTTKTCRTRGCISVSNAWWSPIYGQSCLRYHIDWMNYCVTVTEKKWYKPWSRSIVSNACWKHMHKGKNSFDGDNGIDVRLPFSGNDGNDAYTCYSFYQLLNLTAENHVLRISWHNTMYLQALYQHHPYHRK